jgi:hypothetical protein
MHKPKVCTTTRGTFQAATEGIVAFTNRNQHVLVASISSTTANWRYDMDKKKQMKKPYLEEREMCHHDFQGAHSSRCSLFILCRFRKYQQSQWESPKYPAERAHSKDILFEYSEHSRYFGYILYPLHHIPTLLRTTPSRTRQVCQLCVLVLLHMCMLHL